MTKIDHAGKNNYFYILNGDNLPIFEIHVTKATHVNCDMTIQKVIDWKGDAPSKFESYMQASIRWNSSATFKFGNGTANDQEGNTFLNGYLHFSTVEDFKNHAELVHFLYELSFACMRRKPQRGEEWQ